MNYKFCKIIRILELENILTSFHKNSKVLEIGAGAGWQAQYIANYVNKVEAIDIQDSRYHEESVWPVTIYDGEKIPFNNSSFDIVFSSNVLEHIENLEKFQPEIQRVLKPGGIAIHILPTAAWRLWTSATHYISIIKQLLLKLSNANANSNENYFSPYENNKGIFALILKAIWPEGHGVKGNSVTEIYYFSSSYWKTHFQSTGWEIISAQPNGIFYTGNTLFANRIKITHRRKLSAIFGSATATYIVK